MSVWAWFSVLWCWCWRCSSWVRVEWIETVIAECITLSRIASHVSGSGRNFRCCGLASRRLAAVAGGVVLGLRRALHCVFNSLWIDCVGVSAVCPQIEEKERAEYFLWIAIFFFIFRHLEVRNCPHPPL